MFKSQFGACWILIEHIICYGSMAIAINDSNIYAVCQMRMYLSAEGSNLGFCSKLLSEGFLHGSSDVLSVMILWNLSKGAAHMKMIYLRI